MPQPYDYTSAFDNLQSPQDAIMSGIKTGVGLTDIQNQRAQQARDLAVQQQKQKTIQDLVNNPNATADDYANAALRVPEMHDQFKQAWETKSADQQKSELRRITDWSTAVQTGNPKIASDGMRAQADAIENTAGGPTPESKSLRVKADLVDSNPNAANVVMKTMLMAHPDGKRIVDSIVALGQEQRATDKAPADLRKANADAQSADYDASLKGQGIVSQNAGALAKPGVQPSQAVTMFRTLAARGIITPDQAQSYIDGMPTDQKALPDYMATVRDAGIKSDDQKKFVTPTADATLSADTQRRGQDSTAQTAAARLKFDKEQAAAGDDVATFTPAAIDNAAARYNFDGSLPPMGMGAAASAGRAKILNRAAELKAGVDPTQQRQDQLNTKTQQRVVQEFTSGKAASSVRSFNVGISHLDTLGSLADALDNKDTQTVNRIGNYFATQTGSPAPTNFNAAKKIVGDEIVKAIVGAGGGVHDREEAARVIDGANSPAQLKDAINTYKELMIGQLGGLEQQYRQGSGRTDFERFLSPQAQTLRQRHGGAGAAAGAGVSPGWSVQEVH